MFMPCNKPIHRFLLLCACCCLLVSGLRAQQWTKNLLPGSNFSEIKAAFEAWTLSHPMKAGGAEDETNSEYNRFKRWEAFVRPRLDESGHFPSSALSDEWFRSQRGRKTSYLIDSANWNLVGPMNDPAGGGGMGRLDVIRFQPGNSQILWAGSANGGLWKSMDAGISWAVCNTDHLPSLGVADIAIDPHNTNTMYIATGDGYGYEAGGAFWGGTYSAGILKSSDGGLTWDTTGFSASQTSKNIVQRLLLNPSKPAILLAAARDGLRRSSDAGLSWSIVLNEHIFDLEFKPSADSIVYASGNHSVYKSSDRGLTWSVLNSAIASSNGGRISLAVTPANPNYIYALTDSINLYRSTDGGLTFIRMTSPAGLVTFYGYYDCVLSVSPINPGTVCVGGMQIAKSTDGGASWGIVGNWTSFPNTDYVHCDNHDIEFLPGSDSTFFSADDGGLFKTKDGGTTWTDLSSGLCITQMYRLGSSATNPDIIYTGVQDNGVYQFQTNVWTNALGGDGMECVVDYTNPNNVLVSLQNGNMGLSTDGGLTFNTVGPPAPASWTIPILEHPVLPNVFWAGYDEIYTSTDGGLNWQSITSGLLTAGSTLVVMAVAPSDPSRLYAGGYSELHALMSGGAWTDISAGLPLTNNVITAITVSEYDPNRIWVTLSGYIAGQKVYTSIDAGLNWTNYSGSLPNIPMDAITFENGSKDRLYLGTDFGVYYRDSLMTDWQPFNRGLPNIVVDELEINYKSGKLLAATYGRGLWETSLSELVSVHELHEENSYSVYPNPTKGSVVVMGGGGLLDKATLYNALGEVVISYKGEDLRFTDSRCRFDISTVPNGAYFLILDSGMTRSVTKLLLCK
jgi:photosystem II stability/assembly factor-like uncharacterized protein